MRIEVNKNNALRSRSHTDSIITCTEKVHRNDVSASQLKSDKPFINNFMLIQALHVVHYSKPLV